MSIPAASGFIMGYSTFLFWILFRVIWLLRVKLPKAAVRVVNIRTLPNGIVSVASAISRRHCFDHTTQDHTGETGSIEHQCIVGLLTADPGCCIVARTFLTVLTDFYRLDTGEQLS